MAQKSVPTRLSSCSTFDSSPATLSTIHQSKICSICKGELFSGSDRDTVGKNKNDISDFAGASVVDKAAEEKDDEKEVSALKCGHVFHYDCLMQWIRVRSECPNCRNEIEDPRSEIVRKLYFDSDGDYVYESDKVRGQPPTEEFYDARQYNSAEEPNPCANIIRNIFGDCSSSSRGGRQSQAGGESDWGSKAFIAGASVVAGLAAGALLGGVASSFLSRKPLAYVSGFAILKVKENWWKVFK